MASDASISELAPPGTKVAIGVNVRGLLDSSLAKDLGDEVRGAASALAAGQNLAGFDPLRDVDRVLILATNADGKVPPLIVLRGRFDVEQLAHGAKRYHDVPVIDDAKGTAGAIGLIDGETAIVGELAQVEAAIERRGSGAPVDADLISRIDAAWPRYDVWGLGDCPEGLAGPGDAAQAIPAIDRFSFGATVRQGLELTAEIHPRSAGDGARMTSLLGMFETALKAQQPKDSGAKFDVQSENGTFRISVTVPDEDLRKAIAAQRASLAAAVSKRARGEGPAAARPATLPVREAKAPAPVAPRPQAKTQIVTAPNGDTLYLKLPGGK
jgi:hypothetical protein